jgi:serine/threonine protein kinase/tetratricopeptide (TPR) repeat protein
MRRGDLIAGRFEIERLAGSGGMGEVYRAFDRDTGDIVAIKLLVGSEHARFDREAQVLSQIEHSAVVRYIAHGETQDGDRYLTMEWLEGEDLAGRLRKGPLSNRETVALGVRIAEALGVAHLRGIVHRDIKPENIFLVNREIERAKLLDFGIVKIGDLPRDTRTGMVVGTLGYMAPEQARGMTVIDARADVFALGCVLYECLTGTPAFASEDLMALLVKIVIDEVPRVAERCADVPEVLDDLVARMLAKDPARRPHDGQAVAAELGAMGLIDVAPRSRAAVSRIGLTQGEQRLLSVVLVTPENPTEIWSGRTREESDPVWSIEVLRQIVESRGGRLEALADSSVAATLAGAGIATDQCALAAQCALSLRAVIPDRAMALATGRGEVPGPMPFTARLPVGEVVDRAARLLRAFRGAPGKAPAATGIIIDDVTAGLLDPRFEVEQTPSGRMLRGERTVVEGARTLLGKMTACVGRDREIGTLEATFAQCAEEPMARAILVTAPPGLGKSRVAYEFVQRLRARPNPPNIWVGRADPSGAGSAFGLLGRALRHAAGIIDGEPLPVRKEKLRGRVARSVPEADRARVAEFLGEIVGAPFPDEESVQLRSARRDPLLMGDQMRRAWEDFVRAECAQSPVVLLLEDLHWGDLPTVKLVDAALRALRHEPLMVLALGRPEVHELFPKLWAERELQELRLGELTPKASERLVRQVLGDRVSDAVVSRIVEQADGHAFYLEELIRAVAEGRRDMLPGTVLAMVQARLESITSEVRRVLRAASIFGETFWKGGVAALLGKPKLVEGFLAKLVAQELASKRGSSRFPGEEEFAFRHGLVREAAYASLTDKDRRLGHRLAGEWLERAGETDAMVLAGHFERGEEPSKAVGWYRRAAEQAYEGNDLDALFARAARGVLCGAQGEALGALRLLQAEAHRWRGELAEAEQRGMEAMDRLSRGTAAWYGAAREVIFASSSLGSTDRLLAVVREVRAQPLDESIAGAQLTALGFGYDQLLASGRYDLAAEIHTRVIDAFVQLDAARDPAFAAVIYDVRANQSLYAGDIATFFRLADASLQSFEQAGDLRNACGRRLKMGWARALVGAYGEAERELRDVVSSADRMGLYSLSTLACQKLGMVLARQGRLEEARTIEADAILALAAQRVPRREGLARSYLASILMMLGEGGEAERNARQAVDMLESAPPLCAQALATLAELLLAERRPADALSAADQAMKLLSPHGIIEEGESQVRVVYAEALAAVGDRAAARLAIAEARKRLLARAAAIGDPAFRASFLEHLAENARTLELARQWIDESVEPRLGMSSDRNTRPPSAVASTLPSSEAARCLQEAEQALERGNPEAAIAHAEKGMNHAAAGDVRAQLRTVLARAHGWRNVWAPAKRWAEEALRHATHGGRAFCAALSARMLASGQLGDKTDLISAAALLRDVVPIEGTASALVMTFGILSMTLSNLGEKSLAEDAFERMERVGAGLASKDPVARGWMNRSRAERARLGEEDPWTALRLDEASRESFEEAGDASETALSLAMIGVDRWLLGSYERAEEVLRSALEAGGQRGYLIALTTIYLAWTLSDRGKLAEAGAELLAGFKTERSRGNPALKASSSCALAEILRRKEDLGAAEREVHVGLSLPGAPPLERTALMATLALIRLTQGRVSEALEIARKARAEREALRIFGFKDAFIRLVYIEALLASGDLSGARMPLSRARNRLLARAAKIGDRQLRMSFLERVPENARTLTLAQRLLGETTQHAMG